MKNWYNTMIFLIVSFFPISLADVLKYGMDDNRYCSKSSMRLFWIDDGKSILIIGKNTPPEDSTAAPVCKLIFGSSSKKGKNTLFVKFESFYINDCDIRLSLDQSPSSVFDTRVEKLASLTCEMPTPPSFFTKKNNFLMFSLDREDQYMRDYNFRINITLSGNIAEGPSRSGPSTAVVIIIAVALISTLIVITTILVRYIRLKRVVWRERRAERAIERAIHVYNSQELHRHIPYTTVPSQRTCPTHERLQYGSNNSSSNGHSGNLLIVNLQNSSRSNSDINCSDTELNRQNSLSNHEGNRLNDSNREADTESLPPSYEEALEMPKPSLSDSPIYANT